MSNNLINTNFLTRDEEPIVALCSSRGSGAIAMLRLCGVSAVDVVSKMEKLSSGKNLSDCVTHTIHHGHVVDPQNSNEIIDEVLFFLMCGPKTFTGQDTVEISCHNNHFVIDKIIACAIKCGARQAEPGEFTKRAFLSGKIDLIQAESIHELISAQTQLALKNAMSQLKGSFSNHLRQLESKITSLLGVVEASFEFLDEEQRDLDFDVLIKNQTDELLESIKNLKTHFNRQQQIKEGVRVAFLGAVNAGKSTLFNAVLKKERSIVTEIAGTTRDSVEAGIYRNGNFWTLVDTAGLRKTKDVIEQQGIDRSWSEAKLSDIVLLIIQADASFSKEESELYQDMIQKFEDKLIVVVSKIDSLKDEDKLLKDVDNLLQCLGDNVVVKVSATQNIGVDLLEKEVEVKVQNFFSDLKSPYLLNKRHYSLLEEVEKKLFGIKESFENGIECEFVAYHLRDVLEQFSSLTGKNVNEKMLDSVFRDFCVGK